MDCKQCDGASKATYLPVPEGFVAGQQIFTHTASERMPAGEILIVNHDKHPTHVWVNHGGYAATVPRDSVRSAVPTDPGYLATFAEWSAIRRKAIDRMSRVCTASAGLAATGWGVVIYLAAKGFRL